MENNSKEGEMKLLKVNIKTIPIDIEPDADYFIEYDYNGQPISQVDLNHLQQIDMKLIRYQIQRVINSEGKEIKYGIKLDDNNLFTELVECHKATIDQKIADELKIQLPEADARGYRRGRNDGWRDGRQVTKKQIKKLSWFKRLFNKF
ncbi:MAG: hypothetical protein ACTSWK_17695 [Promethearchaeota archaeon]